jgi:hypothetical protein
MAYRVGDLIRASDINSFVNDVNDVIGLGSGNFGYGATELPTVNVGDTVDEGLWRNLRNAIATAAQHQGTSVNIPPLNQLDQGDIVQAHETLDGDPYDFNSSISAIRSNRLSFTSGNMTTSAEGTVTRGGAWAGTIDAVVRINFGSEDAARHFFNSGGQIEFDGDHPNSGPQASQDNAWRNILNSYVGELRMTHNNFSRTGSRGTINRAWGYYELTGSFQRLYTGNNIGDGAYGSNDVLIDARRIGFSGTRGGNGSAIEFRITLEDEHTGISGSYDQVAGGTNFDFRARRSVIYGIPSPSFSIPNGF